MVNGNTVDSRAETWFTNDMTKTFQIKTWSDTRSNRRDRTYTVQAETAAEALDEATWLASSAIRQWVTICAEIIDVDGHGAPQDCEHDHERLHGGWVLRADGGRDCRERCAS